MVDDRDKSKLPARMEMLAPNYRHERPAITMSQLQERTLLPFRRWAIENQERLERAKTALIRALNEQAVEIERHVELKERLHNLDEIRERARNELKVELRHSRVELLRSEDQLEEAKFRLEHNRKVRQLETMRIEDEIAEREAKRRKQEEPPPRPKTIEERITEQSDQQMRAIRALLKTKQDAVAFRKTIKAELDNDPTLTPKDRKEILQSAEHFVLHMERELGIIK